MSARFDPHKAILLIRQVIGEPAGFTPLHEPRFAGDEWENVKDCLDSGWVSSVGAYVDRFEQETAAMCGVPHAIAVMNGTAALHVCLLLAGTGRGDEVLIPTMSFIATANAVHYCEAVPHFCDSDEVTLGIDAARLDEYLSDIAEIRDDICFNRRTGQVIRALVPMHCFGHPSDLDGLAAVARRWRITLIEDAAESLGSLYKGQPVGRHGRLSALSFNGNKIITTGGGGMILTSDAELARRAKHMNTTAKRPHAFEFDHDAAGFNYRLPNINAALGVAQLAQVEGFVRAKRKLAQCYQDAFSGFDGAHMFADGPDRQSNYWLNALILDSSDLEVRDRFLKMANAEGIGVRPVWKLLHRLDMYRGCPRMDLRTAISLEQRIINLPSSVRHGLDCHGA